MKTKPQAIIRTEKGTRVATQTAAFRLVENDKAEIIFMSRAGKKIEDRDGTFVEVSPEEGTERVLFTAK